MLPWPRKPVSPSVGVVYVNQSLCHSDKGTEQSISNSGISVLTRGPEVSVSHGVEGIERRVRSLHGVEEGDPPGERANENANVSN